LTYNPYKGRIFFIFEAATTTFHHDDAETERPVPLFSSVDPDIHSQSMCWISGSHKKGLVAFASIPSPWIWMFPRLTVLLSCLATVETGSHRRFCYSLYMVNIPELVGRVVDHAVQIYGGTGHRCP
jgi:hypothetical protein